MAYRGGRAVPGRGEWPASRPRCFYHGGKRPLCPHIMRPGGPQRWSVCFGVGKILLRSCENVKLCKTAGCRGSDGDDYRLLGCDTFIRRVLYKIFCVEDGGSRFTVNVDEYLLDFAASLPKIQEYLY